MPLDELRPLVQNLRQMGEWPADWVVAGEILSESYFNFQRARGGAALFGITLFGARANGTGIDEDPLAAVFRAYLLMRLEEQGLESDL